MSTGESVSRWIEELKQGDEAAAAKVWNNYFARLAALARAKLRGAPRRADEEDVLINVFETFFRRAQKSQFPQLRDRQDLWHLLVKNHRAEGVQPTKGPETKEAGEAGFGASRRLGETSRRPSEPASIR